MTRTVHALNRFAGARLLRASCLSVCLVLAGTVATFAKAIPVIFPVNVEAPVSESKIGFAQEGSALLIQPLRYASAARTKAEFPVHFQSSLEQVIGGGPGPKWDFVVPEGSILIGALVGNKQVFCTSKILDDSWVTHYDLAICAADTDRDGTFDQLFLSDDGVHRIRSVAEIKLLKDDALTTVSAPYEPVAASELPALELQITLAYSGNFLTKIERISTGICWPPSLTLPSAGNEVSISCGAMDWKTATGDGKTPLFYNLTTRPTSEVKDGHLIWGPISVTLTGKGASTKGEATALPLGKAVFLDVGEVIVNRDTRKETAVFHLQMLRPAENAAKQGSSI